MSNPMFNERVFPPAGTGTLQEPPPKNWSPEGGWGAPPPPVVTPDTMSHWDGGGTATTTRGRTMSIGGTASASLILLALVLAAGSFGWNQVTTTSGGFDREGREVFDVAINRPWLLWTAMLAGLGLAVLTAFRPALARITAPLYALAQGVLVGMVSAIYDARFDGIVLQAVLATAGVFLVMMVLYGLRILRATPRFVKGVIAATFGIMAMYLVGWIMSLFTDAPAFWARPTALGIGISVIVVIVAALNLIIDFDFIERGSKAQLPASMEWYGAFALTATLIWLYLEMLRLLSLLQQR